VERSEFELPVPVSKLSDDSIMLEFAAARRIALVARRLQYCRRYRAFKESISPSAPCAISSRSLNSASKNNAA
jgi:hypothetical protein